MRILLLSSALLLLLSACHMVDRIGKNTGAADRSRAVRGTPMPTMAPQQPATISPQQQPMAMGNTMPGTGGGYGHPAPVWGIAPVPYPPYGVYQQPPMSAHQRPFMSPYGNAGYHAAPQPPAMPYYYNPGY